MATQKAEETRNRILDGALRLFREHGFDETTMRDIAAEAEVATGAAYYYYRSKEDLVLDFYLRTEEEGAETFARIVSSTTDLKKRIRGIIDAKFEQFTRHRSLLAALLKSGADPRNPLSPFSRETKEIRDDHIAWYARALEGSNVKIPRELAPHLPRLLWLYELGLIYYWIIDDSPRQRKTERLLGATLDLVVQLLRAASLPFMGPLRARVLKVLRAIDAD